MSAAIPRSGPSMPWSRIVGVYVSETRFECLRILRNPAFAAPVIVVPLAFYLLLGVAMAGLRREGGAQAISDTAIFISFAVYGALYPGMAIIGTQLATERSQGLLAYKRALPMPAASYVAAKILMALIFGVVVIGHLVVLAVTLGGVPVQPGRLSAVVAVMAAGVAPGCAMGLLIATSFPPAGANAVANTAFIAMVSLAGLFYPLPPALESMRPIWPAYHLQQLGLAAIGAPSQGDPLNHAFVLVAVTAVFSTMAAWRLAKTG
jgi:ABC-2 type transport system permease protein